jgi:hypothetical protein
MHHYSCTQSFQDVRMRLQREGDHEFNAAGWFDGALPVMYGFTSWAAVLYMKKEKGE